MEERIVIVSDIKPYQAGQFYLRELPCLQSVLAQLPPVDVVIIDAYVWLGQKPGLGAHVYQALRSATAVIGVAKTNFPGADDACEITRGGSKTPLFVSAAGMSAEKAAQNILAMHGSYRIPTLIKKTDQLSRSQPLR